MMVMMMMMMEGILSSICNLLWSSSMVWCRMTHPSLAGRAPDQPKDEGVWTHEGHRCFRGARPAQDDDTYVVIPKSWEFLLQRAFDWIGLSWPRLMIFSLQLDWSLCLFVPVSWLIFALEAICIIITTFGLKKFACECWSTLFIATPAWALTRAVLSVSSNVIMGVMAASIHISIISVNTFGIGLVSCEWTYQSLLSTSWFLSQSLKGHDRMQSEHGNRWPCNADINSGRFGDFSKPFGSSSHHKILQIQVRLTYCSSVSRFQEEKT